MLTYDMDQRGEESLYAYLYDCMRADIENGSIAAGEKLPSKRKLADHLGVSIVTVEGAYRQLIAEGYVESRARRGYFAAHISSSNTRALTKGDGVAPAGTFMPDAFEHKGEEELVFSPSYAFDLSKGQLPESLFPLASWSKALRDTLTQEPASALVGESDPLGCMALRDGISRYLRQTRGLVAPPENIVVGSGAQTLYNLIVQLIGRNRTVGVEDPGYPRLRRVYGANSVRLSPIPLDASGVSMASVHAAGVDTLHITPSHQFPTGIVTSVSRRHELLGWATEVPGRYIIEDDYDCEFRLAGRPIPTLQGIDASERVIYTNTFSKSLGSAFRIAYMVLPDHLARRYRGEMAFYSCTVPAIDQLALARFMQRGEFERHVNRLRTHARDVRDAFLATLKESLPQGSFTVAGHDAGLHFVLGFPEIDDARFAESLAENSVRMPSLREFSMKKNDATNDCRYVVQYLQLSTTQAQAAALAIARAYASTH